MYDVVSRPDETVGAILMDYLTRTCRNAVLIIRQTSGDTLRLGDFRITSLEYTHNKDNTRPLDAVITCTVKGKLQWPQYKLWQRIKRAWLYIRKGVLEVEEISDG